MVGEPRNSLTEIELQVTLLDYLTKAFGAKRFNLYGQGLGGTVALAITHLRPDLVATVGLANPDLKTSSGYSPIDWAEDVLPDISILAVADSSEATEYGVKAGYIGLHFRLVEGPDSLADLARELRSPENRAFWPRQ